MPSTMLSALRDGTLILTLSDPPTRNSLSPQASQGGLEALAAAAGDPAVRCVVLQGDGDHFCGGGNLQRLLGVREGDPQDQHASMAHLHRFVQALHDFPKPAIAAVEGFAAGAGCALVLACDLVVAAEDAKFLLSYGRIGLSPDGGSSWQLARRVPRAQAMQMLWWPEPVGADRWQGWGLVNELVPHGQALAGALAWAGRLGRMAPNALASVKLLMNAAGHNTLPAQLDLEREHFVQNLFHANGGEGLQAFLAKRPPAFVP